MVLEHSLSLMDIQINIMSYKDKLKDPRWLEFRKRVYEKDGYRCTICNTKDRPLNAHHRFYEDNKEPWEYNVGNLDTLCNWCHESIHCLGKIKEKSNA